METGAVPGFTDVGLYTVRAKPKSSDFESYQKDIIYSRR